MITFEILQQCAQGNRDAQKQFYEDNYGFFMGICRRYSKNDEQAKQMFAEVFVSLFKQINLLKKDDDAEKWCHQLIAKNSALFLKQNRAEYYVASTVRVNDKPQTDLFKTEEVDNPNNLSEEEYIKALQNIPPSLRAVYNLHVIDEVDLTTIAEVLEVSQETCKSNIEKARFSFNKNIQLQQQGFKL